MSGKFKISNRFAQVSKAIRQNVYTEIAIRRVPKADIVNDQLSGELQLSESTQDPFAELTNFLRSRYSSATVTLPPPKHARRHPRFVALHRALVV